MANRVKIPAHMLETIEAGHLAEWSAKDVCRNFPHCLDDKEECNSECDKSQNYGDGCQWGDK